MRCKTIIHDLEIKVWSEVVSLVLCLLPKMVSLNPIIKIQLSHLDSKSSFSAFYSKSVMK